jgi:hypothetical protein
MREDDRNSGPLARPLRGERVRVRGASEGAADTKFHVTLRGSIDFTDGPLTLTLSPAEPGGEGTRVPNVLCPIRLSD